MTRPHLHPVQFISEFLMSDDIVANPGCRLLFPDRAGNFELSGGCERSNLSALRLSRLESKGAQAIGYRTGGFYVDLPVTPADEADLSAADPPVDTGAVLADATIYLSQSDMALSGDVPASFVWHHGDADTDGDYPYSLIPAAIHDACLHRGGRSHSGTKR